jgi:hypothetical protein
MQLFITNKDKIGTDLLKNKIIISLITHVFQRLFSQLPHLVQFGHKEKKNRRSQ